MGTHKLVPSGTSTSTKARQPPRKQQRVQPTSSKKVLGGGPAHGKMTTNKKPATKAAAGTNKTTNSSSLSSSASSSKPAMLSTRVCIKNLPLSFTSIKLRDFLKKEYRERQRTSSSTSKTIQELVITDCTVLMHPQKKTLSRRIAFAGFATAQMAQRVVELFDHTFCLTARLTVEPANAAASDKQQPKTDKVQAKQDKTQQQQQLAAAAAAAAAKPTIKGAPTTKELLLAGAGKKAKFWANDLNLGDVTNPVEEEEEPVQKDDVSHADSEEEEEEESVVSDSDSDTADPLVTQRVVDQQQPKALSDLDFLRSKQSMVKDLDEEEEEEEKEEDDPDEQEKPLEQDAPIEEDIQQPNKSSSNVKENGTRTNNDQDSKEDEETEATATTNRLFCRNLPFTTTEEDLEIEFAKFGTVVECHVPVDDLKQAKGFAFVTFERPQDAARAMEELNGHDFQGRFLHVLAARHKPSDDHNNPNTNNTVLSYKERQELAKRQQASKTTKGWSASFVRGDAVVDSLADRLGIRKGDILNVKDGLNSGDAAVRLALGETQVIEENRNYFQQYGIDMEALVSFNQSNNTNNNTDNVVKRSNTSILVKNLPYDTQVEELTKLLATAGEAPKRVLLPPSRTIALADYDHSSDAKKAFRKLAYRRFKNVPIYLEWAPMAAILDPTTTEGEPINQPTTTTTMSNQDSPEEEDAGLDDLATPSIYIKNLNFSTTEARLQQVFEKAVGNVRAVKIPKKLAPVKKSTTTTITADKKEELQQSLSMGFGFVEFGSQESAQKALTKLQGLLVDGHALELKPSTKSLTTQQSSSSLVQLPKGSKKNPTKVAVRNVPFQATRTELLKLFGSYGQLKRVRLPKKFDGGHRGFAFVEFVTHKEALAAMKSLSRTHLYGRHLVLEWAEDEAEDPDTGLSVLRERSQRDIDRQEQNADKEKHKKKRQKLSSASSEFS